MTSTSVLTTGGTTGWLTLGGSPTPTANVLSDRIRQVTIEQLDNGYVVNVGCQRFAFEKYERVLQYLTEYMKDPKSTEEKYFNNKLFKK